MNVAVLLADGFEEIEAITSIDVLRRAGLNTKTLALRDAKVTGANNVAIEADSLLSDEMSSQFDMIVLPGGLPGAEHLRDDARVIEMVSKHYKAGKHVAAICAAPIVLGKAGILEGKMATCYPSFEKQLIGANVSEERVVVDGKIITSRGPGTSLEFALTLVKELKGQTTRDELAAGMIF